MNTAIQRRFMTILNDYALSRV